MRILTITLNTIIAIIFFGALAFLLAPRFGFVNPYEIKIVRSGSMEPAIKTGSVVIIHPESTYSVGDVVTFGSDTYTSVPTTHRIVSMRIEEGTTYVATKGDANEDVDASETPLTKIIGKVVFSLPAVGYIFAFAKTQTGFMLLIGIPAALIICYELISIVAEVKAMRRRKKDAEAVELLADESRELPAL